MGPTWVLSAPDGPHVGPMKLAIRVVQYNATAVAPHIITGSAGAADDSGGDDKNYI